RGDLQIGVAAVEGVRLRRTRRAGRGTREAGDVDLRDVHVGRAAVDRHDRELHRLSRDDQAVVGDRVEGQAVGRDYGVLVVALLRGEADLVRVLGAGGGAHGGERAARRA